MLPRRRSSSWCLSTNPADLYSALQAAQQELERHRASDSLKKGLEHRPDREELERRMSTCPPATRYKS